MRMAGPKSSCTGWEGALATAQQQAEAHGACIQAWPQNVGRPEQALHAQLSSLCLLTDSKRIPLQPGTLLCCSPPAWGRQHAWRCLSLARWEWSHRCCHLSPARQQLVTLMAFQAVVQ